MQDMLALEAAQQRADVNSYAHNLAAEDSDSDSFFDEMEAEILEQMRAERIAQMKLMGSAERQQQVGSFLSI